MLLSASFCMYWLGDRFWAMAGLTAKAQAVSKIVNRGILVLQDPSVTGT